MSIHIVFMHHHALFVVLVLESSFHEGANFELRPAFISLVSQHQFGGSSLEDLHAHLERFIRNCNTYWVHNVQTDAIRLTLFPFSLRDAAKEWLNSQPQGSITTWDDLAEKFTTKFVPRAMLRKMRNEITNFAQSEDGSNGNQYSI